MYFEYFAHGYVERFARSGRGRKLCRSYFFHSKCDRSRGETADQSICMKCAPFRPSRGKCRKVSFFPLMKNVFCNRNFRLAFFGALVSNTGALLYHFAVGFYILNITGREPIMPAVYLAVCSLCTLGANLIGGVIGDRMNKARIMYLCDFVKGGLIVLATAGMLLLNRNVTAELILLYASGILGSIIGGIFMPAANAILPEIVEKEQIQQANSYYYVMFGLEDIAGIVLAAVLYNSGYVYPLFFSVGICYILSGLSELFIRTRVIPEKKRLTVRDTAGDIREGFTYLVKNRALFVLITCAMFINFFLYPIINNFFPFIFEETNPIFKNDYLLKDFLTSQQWFSVLAVLMGIASLAASLIISRMPPVKKCSRAAKICLNLMSVLMLLLAVCYYVFIDMSVSINAFLLAMCAGAVALGILNNCINIPIDTAVMTHVESSQLSKVSAMISIGSSGLKPLAALLAGFVLSGPGPSPFLAICAAGFLVTGLVLTFSKKVNEI